MMDGSDKKKSKRESLNDDLARLMFSYIGKPVTMGHDFYYRFNNPLTREQYIAFKKDAIALMQKAQHTNKRKTIANFNYWYKIYGVRIKE